MSEALPPEKGSERGRARGGGGRSVAPVVGRARGGRGDLGSPEGCSWWWCGAEGVGGEGVGVLCCSGFSGGGLIASDYINCRGGFKVGGCPSVVVFSK